jgi:uncharacterized protein with NAD-binding domain and iron-sulfur cluster
VIRRGRRRKVAVLGGGLGALSAAYELTDQPDAPDTYDITVYQVGWRLGGKAASGRNLRKGFGKRIEEHGIHVFFGCYENAFYLLRRCYSALHRPADAPLNDWQDSFLPRDAVVWAETPGPPAEEFWGVPLPLQPGLPGDLAERLRHPSILPWRRATPPTIRRLVHNWIDIGLRQMLDRRFDAPLWVRLWVLVAALASRSPREAGARTLLRAQQFAVRRAHGHLEKRIDDPGARRLWLNLRMAEVVIRGILADGVLERGFDHLDDEELASWLVRHGADQDVLNAPSTRSGYDAVFSFASAHRVCADNRLVPSIAAGAALRSLLRAYSYRGAAVWKMQSGMGDVVVMPLYQVLAARQVKFNFFHRVSDLELSSDGRSIERIRILPQLRLADRRTEYRPIVNVKGLACWPAEPDYSQLADGDRVRAAVDAGVGSLESPPWLQAFQDEALCLRRGVDFDDVILGISLGGLGEISEDLARARPEWRRMLQRVATTATLAFQWWIRAPLQQLGWNTREFDRPIVTGLVEPVDTWADMSHLVEREDWGAEPVKTIAYFCGPLQCGVDETPARAMSALRTYVGQFVHHDLPRIWPDVTPNQLYDLLAAPNNLRGYNRLAAQYYRANTSGSERYVQTLPGTTRRRLPSAASGFDNLYLAGDWTRNGMNIGCAEATVMSGMQAARAIASSEPGSRPITVWAEQDRVSSLPFAQLRPLSAIVRLSAIGARWCLAPMLARMRYARSNSA